MSIQGTEDPEDKSRRAIAQETVGTASTQAQQHPRPTRWGWDGAPATAPPLAPASRPQPASHSY